MEGWKEGRQLSCRNRVTAIPRWSCRGVTIQGLAGPQDGPLGLTQLASVGPKALFYSPWGAFRLGEGVLSASGV